MRTNLEIVKDLASGKDNSDLRPFEREAIKNILDRMGKAEATLYAVGVTFDLDMEDDLPTDASLKRLLIAKALGMEA